MARVRLFSAGEPARLAGLASLTAPDPSERVSALVDVAVVGARSDGKTQFILHAIRTLGADAPDDLSEPERNATLDIMQVVLAAARPRPDANNPDAGVPHYVFRLQPRKLLEEMGLLAQLVLLARSSRLARALAVVLVAAAAGVLGASLGGAIDGVVGLGLLWLCATAAGLAFLAARRRFVGRGPIEVVFWDVAGENLYGSRQKSAEYWSLLRHLVRRRVADARPERRYGFAPVLICNPLGLGIDDKQSPFGRLRPLLPIFAGLGGFEPEALVVINRWEAVRGLCPEGADRDELVAIAAEAMSGANAPALVAVAPTEPMPVVRRGTIRTCCVDAEEAREEGVHTTVLRYDAGLCELVSAPWQPFSELDARLRAFWAPPAVEPRQILHYRFAEGPRAFAGDARRVFLRWLGRLAFRSGAAAPAPVALPARAEQPDASAVATSEPAAAQTLPMFAADEKAGGFHTGGT